MTNNDNNEFTSGIVILLDELVINAKNSVQCKEKSSIDSISSIKFDLLYENAMEEVKVIRSEISNKDYIIDTNSIMDIKCRIRYITRTLEEASKIVAKALNFKDSFKHNEDSNLYKEINDMTVRHIMKALSELPPSFNDTPIDCINIPIESLLNQYRNIEIL